MKCRTCGTTLSAGALLCGECGTSAIAPRPTLGDTARYDRQALLDAIATEGRARVAAPAPVPVPVPVRPPAAPAATRHADAPANPGGTQTPAGAPPTRTPAPSRALFSLVFSTGESIRVSGDGLIGRNPAPAEGERFDYLVQIVDPQRSVSKTHLQFGVDDGDFWVADRGSSNGTRLGLDLAAPVDLPAGEARKVPRGTRIGIGDQYFDVL